MPLRPRLACGLAGILDVHAPAIAVATEDALTAAAKAVCAHGLRQELDAFLGGDEALGALERAVAQLQGPRIAGLVQDAALERQVRLAVRKLVGFTAEQQLLLARRAERLTSQELEELNRRLTRLHDASWTLERDLLAAVDGIRELAGDASLSPRSIRELYKLHCTLENINRLEIRGRDSAGLSMIFSYDRGSWAELSAALELSHPGPDLAARLSARFDSGEVALRPPAGARQGSVAIGWRVAAEIGKLGENVDALRGHIREDRLLATLLAGQYTDLTIAAHTRWASNGIINLPNCHPLDNRTAPGEENGYQPPDATIHVVLNGDIDNYDALRKAFERATGRRIEPLVTTDAKIIALEIERHYVATGDLAEAFRRAVCSFDGSAAIAMHSDLAPGRVYLSLKGTGQALYVGLLAGGGYVYASEVYGLVAQTSRYLSLSGDGGGQLAILDARSDGGLDGITRRTHDGAPLPLDETDIKTAQITTRDIDRQQYEHFFLKEIHEAPGSVEKTLRGKFSIGKGGRPVFNLGPEILPESVLAGLTSGAITRIVLIGQGTAGVAAEAIAGILRSCLGDVGPRVEGAKASELSGFGLRGCMRDTLVICVTQSGTTADTNRAVEMIRARGAATLAIVNRRDSAITEMVDGVYYTSDGRDIEMSVASTKAFYSQVTAGLVLGLKLAEALGAQPPSRIAQTLTELKHLPRQMRKVLEQGDTLRASAREAAPRMRHWAVVGSGPNFVAAQEVRIKLSELCYKSIACDVVEDKKHIDLSSEPLILVLAAGNPEGVLGDLVKDVAIFKAHKARPIVFASDHADAFAPYADGLIRLPQTSALLALVLNTMAGHLWGYHAARAIDEGSQFLAAVRSQIVGRLAAADLYQLLDDAGFAHWLGEQQTAYLERLREGQFNAGLPVDVAAELALLLGALGAPGPARTGPPEVLANQLIGALTRAIDELSRPVDAIKHQAKTVTVGTSRLEELPRGPVFAEALGLGISLESFSYPDLAELKRIQPAVARVPGAILYQLSGLPADGVPDEQTLISPLQRRGVAAELPTRTEGGMPIQGTKRTIVRTRRIHLGIGRGDARRILIVPLYGAEQRVDRLLLCHLEFVPKLGLEDKIRMLGVRYEDLRNAVVEANRRWDDTLLEDVAPEMLLLQGVEELAGRL